MTEKLSADEVLDAYWLEVPRWRWAPDVAEKMAKGDVQLYLSLVNWRMERDPRG